VVIAWQNGFMPYTNVPVEGWKKISERLIQEHPLKKDELVKYCLKSWDDIFSCKLGGIYQIGKNIFPKPQIMGFFLHELIPLQIETAYPEKFRIEQNASDKDIVCLTDEIHSIEIKTSSDPKKIFGNRSYSQATQKDKKKKSGYYLAINFEKFKKDDTSQPQIIRIRFGWLDHDDWVGQTASSGQQARLSKEVEENKLLTIYELGES